MAVFRIEKTRDYTVMSNHHLKDRTLTLKSKGLLSMMLSLPDEWNYTTRGLAAICREGVDSIGAALKELETHGYIRRTQLRDEKRIHSCLCRAIRPVRHDLVSSLQDGTTVTGERTAPDRKASVAACGR